MKNAKLFVLIIVAALLFGCVMDMKIDQTVNRDGTAKVVETIDFSSMIASLEGLQSSMANYTQAPAPDTMYSLTDYAALPSPESKELILTLKESGISGETEEIRVGGAQSFSFKLENSGEKIEAATATSYGEAFVMSGQGTIPLIVEKNEEYIGTVEKRQSKTIYFFGRIANVEPGTYPLTVTVTFDRGAEKNITVAKTFQFNVLPQEPQKTVSETFNDNMTAACRELMQKMPSVACTHENGVLSISKTVQPSEDYLFASQGGLFDTTYEVTIRSIPNFTESLNTDATASTGMGAFPKNSRFEDGVSGAADSSYLGSAVSNMIKITYTVHMPAEILTAEGGQISEDKMSVTYDVWKLYEKKQNIVIAAKEENTLMKYAVFGIVGLLVIGIAVVLFMKLRPKPPAPSQI